jgi:hypothetical protein
VTHVWTRQKLILFRDHGVNEGKNTAVNAYRNNAHVASHYHKVKIGELLVHVSECLTDVISLPS